MSSGRGRSGCDRVVLAELEIGFIYQNEDWERIIATMYGCEILYYMMTMLGLTHFVWARDCSA
jgi:hypothetical protein